MDVERVVRTARREKLCKLRISASLSSRRTAKSMLRCSDCSEMVVLSVTAWMEKSACAQSEVP